MTEFRRSFYPEIEPFERGDLNEACHKLLHCSDEMVERRATALWNRRESSTVTLLPDEAMIEESATGNNALAIARIENNYFRQKCWLDEGQLLANADRLKDIADVIGQGWHDCCTPPAAGWAHRKAWPEVDLQIVPDSGDLYTEPGLTDGLVRATDCFAGQEQ